MTKVSPKKQYIFTPEEAVGRKSVVEKKCDVCKKHFFIFKSCLLRHGKRFFCSFSCRVEGKKSLFVKYKEKMRVKHASGTICSPAPSSIKKSLNDSKVFSDQKDVYKDKIIDYPNSPTGKAYVGINKSPFMPAADGGYGFQGVLLQDDNRCIVQCHACGQWLRKIADKHLQFCSGLTVQKYKEKYGINRETGLVSDTTSLLLTKACLKNKDSILHKFAKKYGGKNFKRSKYYKPSTEFMNKYGTCPLQLKTRLYEFIRCNRELPSSGNKGRSIYKALCSRYGSFGHALSSHGLPFMKRRGTNMRFAFADGTIYKYNINQFYDREMLFKLLLEKCPCLSE